MNNRDANEQIKNPSVELKEKAQAEGIYLPKQRSKSTQRRKKKKRRKCRRKTPKGQRRQTFMQKQEKRCSLADVLMQSEREENPSKMK